MEQREVTDQENTVWTCVQAYAGLQSDDAEETIGQNDNGTVTVVCTPGGGAQTVRLELNPDWIDSVPDEELLRKISDAK